MAARMARAAWAASQERSRSQLSPARSVRTYGPRRPNKSPHLDEMGSSQLTWYGPRTQTTCPVTIQQGELRSPDESKRTQITVLMKLVLTGCSIAVL